MSRLLHPPVIVAASLLLLASAGALGELWLRDGRITLTGITFVLLPFALLLWAAPASVRSRSEIGIAAWAITMFGALIPAVYAIQSGPENWFVQWRFMLAFGIVYLAALLVFMLWLTTWTAWVPPAKGIAPLSEQRLQKRVRSLASAGLDVVIEQPADRSDQLVVARDFRDDKRAIGVRLTFVPERHCVLAREASLIRGDKPMNASEAQMNNGPRRTDGVHPDAFTIYGGSLAVTPPSAAIRKQIGLRIMDDRIEIAGNNDAAAAPDNLVHVLTELIHQSGWAWQGVFANWQRGCR